MPEYPVSCNCCALQSCYMACHVAQMRWSRAGQLRPSVYKAGPRENRVSSKRYDVPFTNSVIIIYNCAICW